MNSTSTLFHRNEPSATSKNENCLIQFLDGFPEADFWRFFVERKRYDEYRRTLFNIFYSSLIKTSPDEGNLSLEVMENAIREKNLTVGEIYSLVEEHNNTLILEELDKHGLANRKDEKIFDYMNQLQAWVDFEKQEPGYLIQVTNGLKFILSKLINKEEFNLSLIRELHKISTSNVKNMLAENIPGEFRKGSVSWQMTEDCDSIDGLSETLLYLKSVEESYGITGLTLQINDLKNSFGSISINTFIGKTKEQLQNSGAQDLWKNFRSGEISIKFIAEEDNCPLIRVNSNKFLEKISNKLINDLVSSLYDATSKEQKLIAIFTYLKRAVLHHIFTDGVGRTFSMLLLQYLLLRENLLPILIIDSNIFPGKSVKELINEYYRAEKEMSIILNDPLYINSEQFSDPNINTSNLYAKLNQTDKDVFNASLKVYREAKELCLSMMRRPVLTM